MCYYTRNDKPYNIHLCTHSPGRAVQVVEGEIMIAKCDEFMQVA